MNLGGGQTILLNWNTGYLKNITKSTVAWGLITIAPYGESVRFLGPKGTPPQRPWNQTITSSPKHIPGFR